MVQIYKEQEINLYGLDVYEMRKEIDALEVRNQKLKEELYDLASLRHIEVRAQALGLGECTKDCVIYIHKYGR